jgi:hypothetical protein
VHNISFIFSVINSLTKLFLWIRKKLRIFFQLK